jgi:hypothetical protein
MLLVLRAEVGAVFAHCRLVNGKDYRPDADGSNRKVRPNAQSFAENTRISGAAPEPIILHFAANGDHGEGFSMRAAA